MKKFLGLRKNMLKLAVAAAALLCGAVASGNAWAEELSLKGKKIGVSIVGTDHYWDLMAFKGITEEIQKLGGEAIALDAGRKDQQQIAHLQTLLAQKPDAVVEVLGNIEVLNPWLQKIKEAGIPLFTVDTVTPHALNNTTSNNYNIGAEIALQMVADMGGKGNVLVFNGFYSVPVCKIRYDQLKYVLTSFPEVKIIEPELRDVIPNTVQKAYSDVTDMLTKMPEKDSVKAVWACWDVPQIGASQAAEAAGRTEVKTYGIDGSPEVIKMVMDPKSTAAAVAAQQPYEIGKTAVQNVAKHLAGETVPPFTMVPAVLINKANAAEKGKPFLDAAEAAGIK